MSISIWLLYKKGLAQITLLLWFLVCTFVYLLVVGDDFVLFCFLFLKIDQYVLLSVHNSYTVSECELCICLHWCQRLSESQQTEKVACRSVMCHGAIWTPTWRPWFGRSTKVPGGLGVGLNLGWTQNSSQMLIRQITKGPLCETVTLLFFNVGIEIPSVHFCAMWALWHRHFTFTGQGRVNGEYLVWILFQKMSL